MLLCILNNRLLPTRFDTNATAVAITSCIEVPFQAMFQVNAREMREYLSLVVENARRNLCKTMNV